jgi:hypothetical protein
MAQNNLITQVWDIENGDSLPELIEDTQHGKIKSTMTTIFSKHGMEIKSAAEDATQLLIHTSKKKLKDLISKHNNELFTFMMHPEKLPSILHVAEAIFRKYGQDAPTIKGHTTQQFLKDLNLNMTLEPIIVYFDEGLKSLKGEGTLQDFMKQFRWIMHQYRNIGEEVLRLETLLFQKIESLDKIQHRVPLINGLAENDALPELISAFSNYATHVYTSCHFEETYKQLVEEYKKWNICRQLVTMPTMMTQMKTEPHCSICLLESISYAMVPCGHTYCGNCSKKQNTTCFMCRTQIRERVKLFFT